MLVIVTLFKSTSVNELEKIPPPELPLVLPLIVELMMVSTPGALGS